MSRSDEKCGIVWEGSFFVYHSLALVNRELVLALLQDEELEIGLTPYEPDQFDQAVDPRFVFLAARFGRRPVQVDFTVRHRWPPLFTPAEGRLIWMQPWEYGSLPVEWVKFANSPAVAEIWACSSFVRDSYIQSGVDPQKVAVIPLGINPAIFNPEVVPLPLPTEKAFRFLFVGGTIPRKGPDVLLEAYFRAFSAEDDVCLVVKDFGTDSFYRGQGLGAKIEELRRRKGTPEILYLNDSLREAEMAGLYRACDCLVHPYRGEGFGLPVAEAMACGLPVIVTRYGACLDFCHKENALLIDARVVLATEKRAGNFETVGYPYWAEPDVEHLAHLMRWVYENPGEARTLGAQAAAEIRQKFTWDKAAAKAKARFRELVKDRERGGRVVKAQKSNVDELLAQGFQAYTAGKRSRAQKLFEQALAAAPDNADVNYNLGLLYLERQEFAPAAKCLLTCLETEVGSAETWAALGSAVAGLGDFGSAKIAYETALRLDPAVTGAAENLALVEAVFREQPDLWESGWYRPRVVRLAAKVPASEPAARSAPNKADVSSITVEEEAELARITAAIAHAFEGDSQFSRQIKEVIWRGHIYEASGYGDEARGFIFLLNRKGLNLKVIPEGLKEDTKKILAPAERKELQFLERLVEPERSVVIHHLPAAVLDDRVRGAVNIGRTMFETDRLKPEWARYWDWLDEIWVPSKFNVETFSSSGVKREKLRVVPEGIDPEVYNPQAKPLDIRGGKGFVFLSSFDLQDRRGWDILLTAYLTEFRPEEDVALLLKVYKLSQSRPGTIEKRIFSFIRHRLGLSLDKIPEIVLLKGHIEADRMPGLYTACDAFVLPSRGEGWGRPYLEAMACGLPTIGTKWSGNLEFMNEENSFLIEIEGLEDIPEDVDIPVFWGHRWAKPSIEHLRELMRYVFEHREEARQRGRKAREDVVAKWTWERAAAVAMQELRKYLEP